jgi:hypothetical protein
MAREHLTQTEIQEILFQATAGPEYSQAAQQALEDISKKNYPGILKLKAKEIIALGLAIYSHGAQIKAVFGSKPPASSKQLET